VQAVALLVESKVGLYGLEKDRHKAHEVAEDVRRKLYEIHDEVRRSREAVPVERQPHTRMAVTDEGVVDRGTFLRDGLIHDLSQAAVNRGRGAVETVHDDEFDLRYELRESAGSTLAGEGGAAAEVLSDEELDIDLSLQSLDLSALPTRHVEAADALLDKTVQSNLELATRYGALDEQRMLLERKVQELVEVAQQTVHDLNRPISAVRLMLSTLRKGYLGKLDEPVNQALDNGIAAVRQMERLMRDLLDSSRLDHDGVRLEFREVDLSLLVGEVLQNLRYEVEEHDVVVKVEPLPTIKADAWALTKALQNLLGNAIHYGAPDRRTEIKIACRDDGVQWSLSIADNGIGIPAADRARMFRRFERGSNTGGISGTGLGLHIVKEIVQGHGGQVTFDSTEGEGTTFRLHLPKEPVLAPHSPVSSTADSIGI
jgi:signal transduction histidine kinase